MDHEHEDPVEPAADAEGVGDRDDVSDVDAPRPEVASSSSPDAHAGDEAAEPVTRLVLVVLGIALLGLATWWFSPEDEAPAPPPTPVAELEAPPPVPAIVISVIGGIDDRFFQEPCAQIRGGGLSALRSAVDLAREETIRNHLGVSMGDVSLVPGCVGIGVQTVLFPSVIPETGIDVMSAGVGELQFGVGYARGPLSNTPKCTVLCANALDSEGFAVLKGWALTSSGGHNVLSVAVAAQSLQPELLQRGSDIRIGAPGKYAREALAEATRRAEDAGTPPATKLLLVQGTVTEAIEIAAEAPGFDAVVASRGSLLPDLDPADAGGAPVFYAGRGARFLWQLVGGGPIEGLRQRLTRIGDRSSARPSPYRDVLYGIGGRLMFVGYPNLAQEDERDPDPRGEYVGAAACEDCHPDVVMQHRLSPHASLPELVVKGPFAGSPACLGCHVTAPYSQTGWLPEGELEDLAGVSCEACHGPASSHVADPGPGYGAVKLTTCYRCHLPDRSPQFDARAAWDAVGHGAAPPPEEDDHGGNAPGEDGEDDEKSGGEDEEGR